jgi:hypothetical protein
LLKVKGRWLLIKRYCNSVCKMKCFASNSNRH